MSTQQPNDAEQPDIYRDPRFSNLFQDPRFRKINKSTQKLKIDNRFKSMFKDDKFNIKYTVDKYGRRVNQTSSENLKKYYDLSSSEEEEDKESDDEKDEREKNKEFVEAVAESTETEENKVDNKSADTEFPEASDDETISENIKQKLADLSTDYARGKGALFSESSSDDESSEDDENELFIEHVWGELDVDAPRTDESTCRLAACNMDWDRIRASDIMVLCCSFLPPGGSIVSVKIYPSEYGKERMAEEEVKGPQELTERKLAEKDKPESSSDDDDEKSNAEAGEEGDDYNMEKLRQYQLNRLKYYYAVIECDRVSTADKLYLECDGLEYESSATKLDLRFIPDDMDFEDEPKDSCTELPDMSKYQPRLFTTTALQQAKVELTWDENDVDRKELNEKLISGKLNDVNDQELRKYVAYSSEDEEEKEEAQENEKQVQSDKPVVKEEKGAISKYKALLQEINEKEENVKKNKIEMEFSWRIGGGSNADVKSDAPSKDDAEKKPEITQFEKILELKKEKKRLRREEKRKLRKLYRNGGGGGNLNDDSDASESQDDDLPDGIDMNDPYFAEEFAAGDFQDSKKSLKLKKSKNKPTGSDDDDEKKKEQAELELLLDDDGDEDDTGKKAHFSLKKIQDNENETKQKKKRKRVLKKSKKSAEAEKALLHGDDFEINVDDTRFTSIYSSHLFNIDPSDSNYRKTKGMEKLIHEKLKRKPTDPDAKEPVVVKRPKQDLAVSMLVKSIKRKVAEKK